MFVLRLFRGAQIENEAGVISGAAAQRHRLALLALLTIALPRGLTREKLIGYLWPDGDSDHARNLLNQAVHAVRQAIGAEALLSIGDELRLNAAVVGSDVAAFEEALATGDLEGAVDRYEGPFLDGFFLERSAEFERWLVETRERLEREYAKALQGLAKAAESAGDFGAAAEWWRRLLAVDPYSERVVLGLMLALEAAGDRAGAIRQADMHAALLREELDAEPDPEVEALAKRIRIEPAVASVTGMVLDAPTRQELGHQAPPSGSLATPDAAFVRRWTNSLGARHVAVGAAGLAAVVLLYSFRTVHDSARLAPAPDAITTAPAIAVLPFSVHGENLDVWREGMVDLLSNGLDGAAGLRTINNRTVLARWNEEALEGNVDLGRALDVARRTQADYALVGSAVAVGPRIRLVGDVYDLANSESVGQVQVEGSPDSILVLVDRLGVQVLGVVFQEDPEKLSGIDLAGVTTPSLLALKAHLDGEVRFRRADFQGAVKAWERALRADSLFALAYARLAEAYGWDESWDPERASELLDRAYRLSDRLPEREATIIRAKWASRRGLPDGIALLEKAVRKYPDDAEAWYELGDAYYHWAGAMRGLDEAERAFARAAELQPAVAAYRAHLLDLAFEWHADRASIARELEVYARLAPEAARTRAGRVAFALAFGDRTQKARAQVALDSLDSATATAVYSFLRHPRFAAEREAVFLAIDARPDDQARTAVLWLRFHDLALTEGRVREAVALLDDPAMPDLVRHCGPIILSVRGFKVPEEILETLAVSRADGSSLGDSAWVACAATYAADRGRWSDHAALLSHSRAMLARERAAGDTSSEREWDRVVRETEAHGLWRQGRKDEALRRFESVLSSHVDAFWVMWYVGQLSLDLGNLEKAERAFQQIATQFGLSPEPLAHLYLGRIYERTGRPAEALEAYDFFASAWREADPELQPLVQEARQAVTRLTGAKQ